MPYSNTGGNAASLAETLSSHTHQLANLEDAADCYKDIQNLIERIEHTINRPTPPRYCGNCPTTLQKTTCAQPLYAPHTDTHVTCWHCKTTYNIEQLIEQQLRSTAHMIYTPAEITLILQRIGEPIADSTWRRWRATRRIKPAGQLNGKDAYRLSDVRKLRSNTPQITNM